MVSASASRILLLTAESWCFRASHAARCAPCGFHGHRGRPRALEASVLAGWQLTTAMAGLRKANELFKHSCPTCSCNAPIRFRTSETWKFRCTITAQTIRSATGERDCSTECCMHCQVVCSVGPTGFRNQRYTRCDPQSPPRGVIYTKSALAASMKLSSALSCLLYFLSVAI